MPAPGNLGRLPPDDVQPFNPRCAALLNQFGAANHGTKPAAFALNPAEIDHAVGRKLRVEDDITKTALPAICGFGNTSDHHFG